MVCDVATTPVVIELMQTLIIASQRPAWPYDVNALCRIVEHPVDGLGVPCCLRPFCDDGAEWVVLVDCIEDVFEDVGENPAVDVLLGESCSLFVDWSCHGLFPLSVDFVDYPCCSHGQYGLGHVMECLVEFFS